MTALVLRGVGAVQDGRGQPGGRDGGGRRPPAGEQRAARAADQQADQDQAPRWPLPYPPEHGGAEGDLMELNGWISPRMVTRQRPRRPGRRSYDCVMNGLP